MRPDSIFGIPALAERMCGMRKALHLRHLSLCIIQLVEQPATPPLQVLTR